jgi:hypothetical protein
MDATIIAALAGLVALMALCYFVAMYFEKRADRELPERLARIRDLIQQGKIQAAHKQLNWLPQNNPTVQIWKANLNKIEPEQETEYERAAGRQVDMALFTVSPELFLYRVLRRRK